MGAYFVWGLIAGQLRTDCYTIGTNLDVRRDMDRDDVVVVEHLTVIVVLNDSESYSALVDTGST